MIIQLGETEWHDLHKRLTLAKPGSCPHNKLQYIEHGELIKCLDCDVQVTAVWALKLFCYHYEREKERLSAERERLESDSNKALLHRAALLVQDAWRRLNFWPTCPHCHKAIMPPDGFGKSMQRKKYTEEAMPLVMRPNLELVPGEKEA